MEFLYKIENFLNSLLMKLGASSLSLIPLKIRIYFSTIDERISHGIAFIKNLPAFLKAKLPGLKTYALNFDYKQTFVEPLKAALAKHNAGKKEKAGQFKVILLAPFLLVGQWLQGLSAAQSLLLMAFTGGSILSGLSIISSGNRLMNGHSDSYRSPASTEEVSYERPIYYKKETKHFTLTNMRLPVYIPKVNEIRSVDIDFMTTMSTRESKIFLEKFEFQLRDHLILEIEPSVASFPLTEEGKEIIRQKLKSEIDQFIKDHKIHGHVQEIKVVYLLAN